MTTDILFGIDGKLAEPLRLRVRHVARTTMGYAAELSDWQRGRIRRYMRGVLGYCYPYIIMDGVRYIHLTGIGNILKFWRYEND